MQRYSFFALLRNALSFHENWERAWRSPALKPEYDVVIVGAGGHGLATAYFLAKDHGITNVAVLERSWLGGGNMGRNTSTIRSNYIRDVSIKFNDASVKLYEQLGRELNFNIMFSQRSQIDIVQTWPKLRDLRRRALHMDLHGADYVYLTPQEIRRRVPAIGAVENMRLPIIGGYAQARAGIARHDAIAWGFARAGDSRGVDIHQHTEVTGFLRDGSGAIDGVMTNRGPVRARKVALATAGNTSAVAALAGVRLPIVTRNLQAFVSEPMKPIVDVQVNCPDIGFYVSQSDKGELIIGGGTDPIPSYRQGGNYVVFEDTVAALLDMFPRFRRVKLMRHWGGALEFAHDASPVISATPIPGLFVTCGWWGGFKAIPIGGRTYAHLIATGTPHDLAASYTLDRFPRLDFVLEAGTVAAR
jgi:sarcosine oxidase subunit beta